MKISPEILNELKTVSPFLAGLEKINVFQVPEGYFGDLHQRITDFAILNNISPVDSINKRNLQQVPSGYFDGLSESILARVKAEHQEPAEEELRNLSPMLFSLKEENIFLVPVNYFDTLGNSILEKIFSSVGETADEELLGLSSILYSLKGKNVFSIPENYFNTLGNSVAAQVNATAYENANEELHNLSPVLHSLKEKNVYSVPGNYFESIASNVLRKLEAKPAKVVTMYKQKSWWKYAAAAIVTGVIAFSSLEIFNSSDKNGQIAIAVPAYVQASYQYKTEDQLNAGIAKLDDADIIKYLEKNGNVMDNELLTNNTDVSEMPSQTDYLNDENTLNEYLDKIDAQTDNKSNP